MLPGLLCHRSLWSEHTSANGGAGCVNQWGRLSILRPLATSGLLNGKWPARLATATEERSQPIEDRLTVAWAARERSTVARERSTVARERPTAAQERVMLGAPYVNGSCRKIL